MGSAIDCCCLACRILLTQSVRLAIPRVAVVFVGLWSCLRHKELAQLVIVLVVQRVVSATLNTLHRTCPDSGDFKQRPEERLKTSHESAKRMAESDESNDSREQVGASMGLSEIHFDLLF